VTSLSVPLLPFSNSWFIGILANKFTRVKSLDVSGCVKVTTNGIKKAIKAFKLLSSVTNNATAKHSLCKHLKVNPPMIRAIGSVPTLASLSLTLGSTNKFDSLAPLMSHKRLAGLELFLEGFDAVNVVMPLPALRVLRLQTGSWTHFSWPLFFVSLKTTLFNFMPALEEVCLGFERSSVGREALRADQWLMDPGLVDALKVSSLRRLVFGRACRHDGLGPWEPLALENKHGQRVDVVFEDWHKVV
jgi:hypothetical protein